MFAATVLATITPFDNTVLEEGTMGTEMNRRSFLGLAALGSLAAGAGLVGCSPQQNTATPSEGKTETADKTAIPRKTCYLKSRDNS